MEKRYQAFIPDIEDHVVLWELLEDGSKKLIYEGSKMRCPYSWVFKAEVKRTQEPEELEYSYYGERP